MLLSSLSAHSAVTYPLRWRWSNPTPHGNNIINMAYSPLAQRAVQVTERGQIYTSEDLILWTPRDSGTTDALRAVTFFQFGQTNRIVITGESGRVLYADSVDSFQNGTLIDGPTTDWLEGVAASPTLLVACGDSGAVYTSNNGIQWKKQTFGAATDLNSIAWGPNGFVIAGDGGVIGTSTNGTNWTRVTIGTANWNRVAFSPGAGRYTAAGTGGDLITSTNTFGFNWIAEDCGASNELFAAAQANVFNAPRLIAGSNEVRLFEDGIWSNELAKGPNGPAPWTYFSAIAQPNFFLLAGRTGMLFEGYKTNGSPFFWIPSTDAFRPLLFDATYVSNLFVAVGDRASVFSSDDGVRWELELVPSSVTNSIFLGVGGNTNRLIAVGNQGSLIYSLPGYFTNIVSTNISGTNTFVTNVINTFGVIWDALQPRFTTNDLQGVCVFSNLFVVSGENGKIYTSTNGTNWTQHNTSVTRFLSSVTVWPGGLVASGDNGNIHTSSNGINWTKINLGIMTNWLYRVRYLGGKLIAVGQNGSLYISYNSINWTKINLGITTWIHDVTMIDNTYFLLGKQGLVMTSTNATNWIDRGTITTKSIYGAATDSRRLICVGLEGMILRSPVVPDLTPPEILGYSRIVPTNSMTVANLFLFGGKTDQRFTLDYRPAFDTNQWRTSAQLEFYDSSGTLFYLETFPGTNAPSTEFYRATLTP